MKEMYYRFRKYPGMDPESTRTIRSVRFHVGVWRAAPAVLIRNGEEFPLAEFAAGLKDRAGRAVFDVADQDGAVAIEEAERVQAQRASGDALRARIAGAPVVAAQSAAHPDYGAEQFSKEKLAAELDEKREAEEAAAKVAERQAKREAKATGEPVAPAAPEARTPQQAPGGRRAQRLARRGGASK